MGLSRHIDSNAQDVCRIGCLTRARRSGVVADHGDPIPPEEQKRIFEPFVRGKASADIEQTGFGLGLSIVWRICMRMGWQVNLASGPDGNAFTVTLVSPADAAESARRSDELG